MKVCSVRRLSISALTWFGLGVTAACGVTTEIPDAAVVICVEDTDCAADEICLARGDGMSVCTAENLLDDQGAVLLDPADSEVVVYPNEDTGIIGNRRLVFSWAPIKGAESYLVDVSTDASFTSSADVVFLNALNEEREIVPGEVISGEVTRLILDLTRMPTRPAQIYWRVRGNNTTLSGVGEVRTVHFLSEAIYVDCPGETLCRNLCTDFCAGSTSDVCDECLNRIEVGNRAAPFSTIQSAIDRAAQVGMRKVLVATRSDLEETVAYRESLRLAPGVELFGGYDDSFSEESRDPLGNRTVVESSSQAAAISIAGVQISDDTLVEGFEFSVPSSTHGTAMRITDSTGALVVRSNRIVGGSGLFATSSIGIDIIQSGSFNAVGPLIEACDIEVFDGVSQNVAGVRISESNAVLWRNSIRVNPSDEGSGLPRFVRGIELLGAPASSIVENDIEVNVTSVSLSAGIELYNFSSATLLNNTVRAGAAVESYGLFVWDDSDVVADKNVLIGGAGSEYSAGFAGFGPGIKVVSNSVLIGARNPQGTVFASCGAYLNETGPDHLVHNLMIGGAGPGDAIISTGVLLEESPGALTNNIIASFGDSSSYGVYEDDPRAQVSSARHNAFTNDASALYRDAITDESADVYVSSFALEVALDGTPVEYPVEGISGESRLSGNFDVGAVADLFSDLDGPDDDLLTPDDNDYRLSVAGEAALNGMGFITQDGPVLLCGAFSISQDTEISCGNITEDLTGEPRATIPAVGPVE